MHVNILWLFFRSKSLCFTLSNEGIGRDWRNWPRCHRPSWRSACALTNSSGWNPWMSRENVIRYSISLSNVINNVFLPFEEKRTIKAICSVDNILHVSWSGQYYVHKSKCVNQSFSWDLFYIPSCKMLARSNPGPRVVSNSWSLARLSRLHKNWNEEPLVVEALHRVIRLFGVQRCMFASNAPVDQQDGWPPSRVFRVTSLNFQWFFCMLFGRLWNSIKMKHQVTSRPSVFCNEIGKNTIE